MIKLNLDKNLTYILGCSFGPDSMALFNLLLEGNYKFVVCNIDYNYRDGSVDETNGIREICKAKNIDFYTKSVLFSTIFHNFEGWAREIRYDYFKEIGRKIGVYNIVVAHQKDDLLETYFMQKERQNLVSFYGLNSCFKSEEFLIFRPLLEYRKKDLLDYCNMHKVPYIIDPTNADTTLKRNYYRNVVIPKLSDKEIDNLMYEVKMKNDELKFIDSEIERNFFNYKIYINNDYKTSRIYIGKCLIRLLNCYFNNNTFSVTNGIINSFIEAFKNYKKFYWKLNENFIINNEENFFVIFDKTFNYELDEDNQIIKINKKNPTYESIQKLGILTIKPAKLGSNYKISNYEVKINRLFIDWKMPKYIRNIWPAIFDKNNNILYIPRYNKDFKKFNRSLLNFNIDEIYENLKK